MQLVNSTLNHPSTNFTRNASNATGNSAIVFDKVAKANNPPVNQPAIDSDIKQNQSSKELQYASDKHKAEFSFNQEAIALLQKQEMESAGHGFNNHASQNPTSKEQVSFQNQTAVNQYQAVGNLAQRESVQQMFGVDLFA